MSTTRYFHVEVWLGDEKYNSVGTAATSLEDAVARVRVSLDRVSGMPNGTYKLIPYEAYYVEKVE